MVRGLAFVEGPTEEKFIRETVAPAFWPQGVYIEATTPGRPREQGGVPPWAFARKDILEYLKQDTKRFVTTMFDYYAMPLEWPGRDASNRVAHNRKAETVEKAVADDIAEELGDSFDAKRFIPYVQMHEFEALLFCEPDVLATTMPEGDALKQLQAIADKFRTPEEINDSKLTAPSKRIKKIYPGYRKVVHGNIVAKKIGLNRMRELCPHFNEWIESMERLSLKERA